MAMEELPRKAARNTIDPLSATKYVKPTSLNVNNTHSQTLDQGENQAIFISPSSLATDFTPSRKHYILLLASISALFSPLSSSIYYPALTVLSDSFHVSIQQINLTITTYMIVSGIGPALISDLADRIGRRPVYICTLGLYFAVNLGLAFCDGRYEALLVLRGLQSLGASGGICLMYGTVSDLWERKERGWFVGLVACGPNLAPTIGPILGAVLAEKAGWRWIFLFLAISSGICFIIFLMTFPETVKSVRGEIVSPSFLVVNPLKHLFDPGTNRERLDIESLDLPFATNQSKKRNTKFVIPNPLSSLLILFHRKPFLLAVINSIFYTCAACVQASLSTQLISVYNYSTLEAGLFYIPFGVGTLGASSISGWILNRDYNIVAAEFEKENIAVGIIKSEVETKPETQVSTSEGDGDRSVAIGAEPDGNIKPEKKSPNQALHFPIERARLRSAYIMIIVATASLLGYGWTIEKQIHVSLPVLMSVCLTVPQTIISNQLNTLMTDLHPLNPSTSQASMNIARCSLAAAGLAILQLMIDGIGPGLSFLVFGVLCACTGGLCWVLIK